MFVKKSSRIPTFWTLGSDFHTLNRVPLPGGGPDAIKGCCKLEAK
jgi:hypothetical protein